MELKELTHIINTHLKDNSLAEAVFSDDFFEDSILIEHPKNPKGSSSIVITKEMGCWELQYEKIKGKGVTMELKIELTNNHEDVNEIVNFVNTHTLHETPALVTNEN